MADVLIQESSLQAIAAAIRQKNGTQNTYTPAQMGPAAAALSGSTPVLGTKLIDRNGATYNAADDGLDGYSSITVAPLPDITPYSFDLANGYVRNGTFYIGGADDRCDVYRVYRGHTYCLCLGSTVGNRFWVMYSAADTSRAAGPVSGTGLYNANDPAARLEFSGWSVAADGYVTVYKDSAGTNGLRTFLFDITLLEDVL